jgi:hypothetical protein
MIWVLQLASFIPTFQPSPHRYFPTNVGTVSVSYDVIRYPHRTELYSSDDGDFTEGGPGWNGAWTGVYGLLERREVDAAYIPITMTSSMLDVMAFTVPLIEMRYRAVSGV